jgi:hypothetical protein
MFIMESMGSNRKSRREPLVTAGFNAEIVDFGQRGGRSRPGRARDFDLTQTGVAALTQWSASAARSGSDHHETRHFR